MAAVIDIAGITAQTVQVVSPSGITSGEAFGSATVSIVTVIQIAGVTAQTVTAALSPSGISTGEVFGTASVSRVAPGIDIADILAFTVDRILTWNGTDWIVQINPPGISSGEAFGTPTVTSKATISPTGITSGQAFGTPSVTPGSVTISPTGIASSEALGTPVVSRSTVTVSPTGIASGQAFGTPTVIRGTVILAAAGIASGEAFGTPFVAIVRIAPLLVHDMLGPFSKNTSLTGPTAKSVEVLSSNVRTSVSGLANSSRTTTAAPTTDILSGVATKSTPTPDGPGNRYILDGPAL